MKKAIKSIFKFILLLSVLASITIVTYLIANKLTGLDVFNLFEEKKKTEKTTIDDNTNGIYYHKVDLGKSYYIYGGCDFESMYYYIVIMNDEYRTYHGSCMSIYEDEKGKTSDLKIEYDEELKKYRINKDNLDYIKDDTIKEMVPHEMNTGKIKYLKLDSYRAMTLYTQEEGHYYGFKSMISGTYLTMELGADAGEYVIEMRKYDKQDPELVYSYSTFRKAELPYMYIIYDKVYSIESKYINDDIMDNHLIGFNDKGITYNLKEAFPIMVNGVELELSDNKIIWYDRSKTVFRMVITKDREKICEKDSYSSDIAFYEFEIPYAFDEYDLTKPKFVKTWLKKDGCSLIENIRRE